MIKKLYIILLAAIIPVQCLFAQDFSARCSSGQILYYKITSNQYPYTVSVVAPSDNFVDPYQNHTRPVGDIIVPAQVVNKGVTYSVTTIGKSAFVSCHQINSITLPNTIKEISESSFDDCVNLSSLILGSGLQRIDNEAFYGCRNLTSIVLDAVNPPLIYNSTFTNVPVSVRIMVPAASIEKYQSALTWSNFQNYSESGSVQSAIIEQNISQLAQTQTVYIHDTIQLTKVVHDTIYLNTDCPPARIQHDTIYQERIIRKIDTLEVIRLIHDTIVTIQRENIYINDLADANLAKEPTTEASTQTAPKEEPQVVLEEKHPEVPENTKKTPLEPIKEPQPAVKPEPKVAPKTEPKVAPKAEKEAQPKEEFIPTVKAEPKTEPKVEPTPVLSSPVKEEAPAAQYRLSVVSSNEDYGSVKGSGRYEANQKVEISATPNEGYKFRVWSDGVPDNPRKISVTDNRLYIAVFDVQEDEVAAVEAIIPEVLVSGETVVVKGAQGYEVNIFDVYGRAVISEMANKTVSRFVLSAPGNYVVKVGDHYSQRVLISK